MPANWSGWHRRQATINEHPTYYVVELVGIKSLNGPIRPKAREPLHQDALLALCVLNAHPRFLRYVDRGFEAVLPSHALVPLLAAQYVGSLEVAQHGRIVHVVDATCQGLRVDRGLRRCRKTMYV